MSKIRIITINLPKKYLAALQLLEDHGVVESRSAAIRKALREFLYKELEFYEALTFDFTPASSEERKKRAQESIATSNLPKFATLKEAMDNRARRNALNYGNGHTFSLQTIVLGSKEEFLRSRQLNSQEIKDYTLSYDPSALDKEDLKADDDWVVDL